MAIQVNLRVSDELRDQLIDAAASRGVSMNKEINDRLARSFISDKLGPSDAALEGLLTVVAAAMGAAGWAAGSFSTLTPEGGQKWLSNPLAYEQAKEAATQVLRAAAPIAEQPSPPSGEIGKIVSSLGLGFANVVLEEAANGYSRVSGMADRAKALHAAAGAELAARFKAGEPREPLIMQVMPASQQSPAVLAKLSSPISRKRTKK